MNYFGIGYRRWYLGRLWDLAGNTLIICQGADYRTFHPGTFHPAPRRKLPTS